LGITGIEKKVERAGKNLNPVKRKQQTQSIPEAGGK
jgi:hypothetical protein